MYAPASPDLASSIGLCLLAAVVFTDVLRRRIPNPLVAAIAAVGLVEATVAHGLPGLLAAGGGFVVGGLLLLVPYRAGFVGAGDVKLLAALGAFCGLGGVIRVVLGGALVGGVLSLGLLAAANAERRRVARDHLLGLVLTGHMERIAPAATSLGEGVPFGVALALAGAFQILAVQP